MKKSSEPISVQASISLLAYRYYVTIYGCVHGLVCRGRQKLSPQKLDTKSRKKWCRRQLVHRNGLVRSCAVAYRSPVAWLIS